MLDHIIFFGVHEMLWVSVLVDAVFEVVVNMIHDQTLALSGFKGFLCMGLAIRSL